MGLKVKPWSGEPGYLCLPRAKNIPDPKNDWELIECPECGAECYMPPLAKRILGKNSNVNGVCTLCALKNANTMGQPGGLETDNGKKARKSR